MARAAGQPLRAALQGAALWTAPRKRSQGCVLAGRGAMRRAPLGWQASLQADSMHTQRAGHLRNNARPAAHSRQPGRQGRASRLLPLRGEAREPRT